MSTLDVFVLPPDEIYPILETVVVVPEITALKVFPPIIFPVTRSNVSPPSNVPFELESINAIAPLFHIVEQAVPLVLLAHIDIVVPRFIASLLA